MSVIKKILILGSTGSIGKSACNCVRRFKDRFTITGLAAGNNVDLLIEQVREFSPSWVYVTDVGHAKKVKEIFGDKLHVYNCNDSIEKIVEDCDYDIMINALVGAVGFRPTVAALKRDKRVALANKESLVIGGDYINSIIKNNNDVKNNNNNNDVNKIKLLPVDSEHSAILQCLQNGRVDNSVESIILTASGGPFRDLPKSEFESITPAQALNHPTWEMGKKITIDSSTLMNKGFEIIEAHHLFALPYSKLRVCVHPQSIIHSLVEFHDGAVIAQLGLPDMELPIQYALSWPDRLPIGGKRLSLSDIKTFEFYEPDLEKFPCLRLCIEAGEAGGTMPAVLNAANEIAVDLFLNGRIKYIDIAKIVGDALDEHHTQPANSVDVIMDVDREVRERVKSKFR